MTKRKVTCISIAACTAVMAGGLVACGSDDDGGSGSDAGVADSGGDGGSTHHNAVLAELGIETELGARLDPDGNPVGEDYNPLGEGRTFLHRLDETFVVGIAIPDGRRENILGDVTDGYGLIHSGVGDEAWTDLPKVSTSGDFDGDGRQEIAILVLNNNSASADYKSLQIRVVEDQEEGYLDEIIPLFSFDDLDRFTSTGDWFHMLDIAAGDLDGDGRDEMLATCLSELIVLDDQTRSFEMLFGESYPRAGESRQYLRVTAGDTDGDGTDEMVVVDGQIAGASGSAYYHRYDAEFGLEDRGLIQVVLEAVPYLLMSADVAIGDIDGDQLGEIVFSGRDANAGNRFEVLIMDDARAGHEFLPVHHAYGYSLPLVRVETGDFDGDGVDEIISYTQIIDDVNQAEDGVLPRLAVVPHPIHWGTSFAVGDVSDDYKDDIVYLRGGSGDFWLFVYGVNSVGNFDLLNSLNTYNDDRYTTLTTVDVDDDGAALEFIDRELLFTEPRIIAAMAAPPWYDAIPMDLGNSGTSFGKGTATGVEKEQSIGFTTGFSVGTEFEDRLFSQSKHRLMFTVETAMDWISSSSTEVETAYHYSGTADSDKVLFTSVPFDVFYYRVVASPVAEEVGSTVVVNVPRSPQTLFVDREFYNETNGNFFDIDEDVFTHTIGVPSSYPSESSVNKGVLDSAGGFYSDVMTVGQGSGSETIEINVSQGQGSGTSFDLNVGVEYEAGSGGFVVGGSAGFHYGYSYRVTSTESTYYSGTVGNILDAADWNAHRFDFGLFVEPMRVEGQRFPRITYWVDGAQQ